MGTGNRGLKDWGGGWAGGGKRGICNTFSNKDYFLMKKVVNNRFVYRAIRVNK